MTWQLYDTEIPGKQSQALIDDSFVGDLPNIAWIGVWCQPEPEGQYWPPEETDILQQIEDDLPGLANEHSNGRAEYVRRLISVGQREYISTMAARRSSTMLRRYSRGNIPSTVLNQKAEKTLSGSFICPG